VTIAPTRKAVLLWRNLFDCIPREYFLACGLRKSLVTACRYRGIQTCAGFIACVIVVLFSTPAIALTNVVATTAEPTHNDKSGLANLALQVVGQIQSQQQATLQAVQASSKQNAQTNRIVTAMGILLGAGLFVMFLYLRAALRSIQRRTRPLVIPSSANGITQRLTSLMETGEALLNLKQPGYALICFEEALILDGHRARVHLKKAAALEQLGRLDEALVCYDHAIALDDSLADAYVGKGAIYNRFERYREALQCYEEAARLQPTINISQIHSLPRAVAE
jgi:tetratricopeptide (TPR) repeat protein